MDKDNIDRQMDTYMDRQIDRWIDILMDRQIDRQIDGQIDRWTDRQIDGHIDRYIYRIRKIDIYTELERQMDKGNTGQQKNTQIDR